MEQIKYYAYLKCNNEKTGDSVIATNEISAIEYFAKIKLIRPEDWDQIYYVTTDN